VTDRPRGIPDRLRETIGDKGWSVRYVADAAGLSEQAIRGVLAGADPRCSTIDRLARALGVPAGWLAFGG
jgi:transcriptional regulator with XRE-family HTH domain